MKYLKYILFTVAFFTMLSSSWASKVIKVDGKVKQYNTGKINENEFIEIGELRKIFFNNYNLNKTNLTLQKGSIEIKLVPGSFFISFKIKNDIRIAQLHLPVSKIKQNIYVPEVSLFTALDSLGLYKVDLSSDVIEAVSLLDDLIEEDNAEKEEQPQIAAKKLPKIKFDLNLYTDNQEEKELKVLSKEEQNFTSMLESMKLGLVELDKIITRNQTISDNTETKIIRRKNMVTEPSDLIITSEEGSLPKKQVRVKAKPNKKKSGKDFLKEYNEEENINAHTKVKKKDNSEDVFYIPKNIKVSEIEEKLKEK